MTESIEQRIIAALDKCEDIIWLPTLQRPRKTKKKSKSLLVLDKEDIPETGECPGGKYFYETDLEKLIQMMEYYMLKRAYIAIDIETGAAYRESKDEDGETIREYCELIDPHTCPVFLISLSVQPGEAVVFDVRPWMDNAPFLTTFKRFLQTCRFIAHNSIFEQSFFIAKFGVAANIVFDTLIVAQLLTAGLDTDRGLGDLLLRYCGIQLDKKWQKFFLSIDYNSPIPAEAIGYSAGDVCQLLTLAKKLNEELKSNGLYEVWTKYEQPFTKWLALAKVEGIGVDIPFFENLNKEISEQVDEVVKGFEAYCPGVLISSPAQVMKWFEEQGVKLASTDVKSLQRLAELDSSEGNIKKTAEVILRHRKLSKMQNTYVTPIITSLPSPITGRVHPNWKQCSTDTGRMAAERPNFQNIPSRDEWVKIRKGFIAKPGHTLVWVDYCFTGDTKIDSPLGKIPIKDLKVGDPVYTYRDERVELGSITEHKLVDELPCVLVKLDNGEEVRCTKEHKFIVIRPGINQWKKREIIDVMAGDLQPGDRLLPLKRHTDGSGYVNMYSHSAFKYSKEHILVAEAVHGDRPDGYHTHHKDGDKANNHPDNLTYKDKHEHLSEHSKENYKKQDHTLRKERARIGVAAKDVRGERNPNWGNRKGPDIVCLFCGQEFYKCPTAKAKYCSNECRYAASRVGLNCKVVSVEELPGVHPVYSIAVDPDHNYALAAGVFVRNSQFESRLMADMSDEDKMIDVFIDAESIEQELSAYLEEHNLPDDILESKDKSPEEYDKVISKHPIISKLSERLDSCDFHKRTASLIFDVPTEEVSKEQRTKAKNITYAKTYGAGPRKIAQTAGISVEKATEIFREYDKQFPKLAAFFEQCRENGKRGFTQSPSGRKRFYEMPNFATVFLRVKEANKKGGKEWEKLTSTYGTSDIQSLTDKIFNSKVGAIEREACNAPIQGGNADATKLATNIAGPRLQQLHKDIRIIFLVHDEIGLTCPEEVSEQAADILGQAMLEAAASLMKRTPVGISSQISKRWGK